MCSYNFAQNCYRECDLPGDPIHTYPSNNLQVILIVYIVANVTFITLFNENIA